jgi:hypothetical protein
MAEFNAAVLTAGGIELNAKVQSGRCSIAFTKAATGDGNYEDGEVLITRTELKSKKQEFLISSLSVVNESTTVLRFIVTNHSNTEDLKHGYYIKEVGIYAEDPDKGEILYAIATAVENEWDYMPAYNNLLPSTNTMDFYTEVSNASDVIIRANPGAYALASDVEGLERDVTEIRTSVVKITDQLNSTTTSIISMALVLQTMTDAQVIDSDNIAVETFKNADDLIIHSGILDSVNRRIYA